MTVTASPAGLDATQRTQLERLVIRARALLEDDLGAQAEGRFGIHADGTIEDEARPSRRRQRSGRPAATSSRSSTTSAPLARLRPAPSPACCERRRSPT